MTHQHGGDADGARSGSDAEAWRALILGVLERFDALAAGLLGEGGVRTGESGGRAGARGGPGPPTDFAGQARIALDGIIEEAGELLWQILGQLIAILEAIQAALEQVIGAGAAAPAPRSPGETGRDAAYQPITVRFEPVRDDGVDRT
ncbi:hypothetical protein [Williamsia soli]|uniref:hypothetical protein n=1 Tax=Williamsia soli TaxID=364929 RepID=UPI001A9E6CD4|nr:hypothetical protein [Williamsia soli]